ncbi:MAG: hypothetical protein ACRDZP_05500, partial [Acidimicrobiales bacterium]
MAIVSLDWIEPGVSRGLGIGTQPGTAAELSWFGMVFVVGALLDGPLLDGPVLDGPVLDGPVLDGPVLDGGLPARFAGGTAEPH